MENRTHYNSSLSSTFTRNGTEIVIDYPVSQGYGFYSEDDIGLAGVTVKEQTFIEATQLWSREEAQYTKYEGIIGLSPGDNLLSEMFKQGLTEQHVFSLQVPKEENGVGELRIGGFDPSTKSDIK